MIQVILEARAKIKKIISFLFGWNENKKNGSEIYWPLGRGWSLRIERNQSEIYRKREMIRKKPYSLWYMTLSSYGFIGNWWIVSISSYSSLLVIFLCTVVHTINITHTYLGTIFILRKGKRVGGCYS